ncbi:MAG: MFS transporter [Planctomycetota bacterium]|nr:MFS transporter [Planctomycetota bacterium]
MPLLSRPGYRWELIAACFFPCAIMCVEGGVSGVIAQKAFNAGGLAIATIAAAPAMANITSLIWTKVLRGRDRVAVVNLMQLGVIASVLLIAAAPLSSLGVVMLVAGVLLARALLSGIINARADIWRSNYPRNARARATGKLTVITTLITSTGAIVLAAYMDLAGDQAANSYRIVFVAAALIALIGVWAFSHVRWRGRLASRRGELATTAAKDDPATPRGMLAVLRRDPLYRRFMSAQFVLGIGNLAALPPFIIAIDETLDLGYTESIALTHALPLFIAVLVVPLWARLLDRTHIVRFRVFHSWVFVAAHIATAIGLALGEAWILYLSRIIIGVAFGGGFLAWNLGHHDFAPKNMASVYMGIHVTLTGVRGVAAPFIGTLLYAGWVAMPNGPLPGWSGLGPWTFLVFALICATGGIMFLRLNRRLGRRAQPRDA